MSFASGDNQLLLLLSVLAMAAAGLLGYQTVFLATLLSGAWFTLTTLCRPDVRRNLAGLAGLGGDHGLAA